MTPSRIALATIDSASAALSRRKRSAMSPSEMREYAAVILRRPVLSTLCRSCVANALCWRQRGATDNAATHSFDERQKIVARKRLAMRTQNGIKLDQKKTKKKHVCDPKRK